MTETNELLEKVPCVRGCMWDAIAGEPARPKAANHGLLCDSCFYRITTALGMVPDLMANMRAQIGGIGGANYGERVSGGGDGSPAPLRIGPLDAGDSLHAKLVSWTELFADELGQQRPSFSSWRNATEVQGARPSTVEDAHWAAAALVGWFTDRIEDIAASPTVVEFHDDLVTGWEDARGVFPLSGAYGVTPRPVRAAEKRVCPLCGAVEVFVKFPDTLDPEIAVMCGRCAWVADPDLFTKRIKEMIDNG